MRTKLPFLKWLFKIVMRIMPIANRIPKREFLSEEHYIVIV